MSVFVIMLSQQKDELIRLRASKPKRNQNISSQKKIRGSYIEYKDTDATPCLKISLTHGIYNHYLECFLKKVSVLLSALSVTFLFGAATFLHLIAGLEGKQSQT